MHLCVQVRVVFALLEHRSKYDPQNLAAASAMVHLEADAIVDPVVDALVGRGNPAIGGLMAPAEASAVANLNPDSIRRKLEGADASLNLAAGRLVRVEEKQSHQLEVGQKVGKGL